MMKPSSLFDTPEAWRDAPLDALDAWLTKADFGRRGKTGDPQTLRASSQTVYRAMCRKLADGFGIPGRGWETVTPDDLHAFLAGQALRKETQARYLRLTERLFAHLVELGAVTTNPASRVALTGAPKKQANEKTVWLSAGLERQVIATLRAWPSMARGEAWKAQRDQALVALALGGGLRVGEIVGLTVSAIPTTLDNGTLRLTIGPCGAGRIHHTRVDSFATELVLTWLTVRKAQGIPGKVLFPSSRLGGPVHPATVYRRVAAILEASGIPDVSVKRRGARTLRTTYALKALSIGESAALVGEYLGHRADRSTRYYTALVRNI